MLLKVIKEFNFPSEIIIAVGDNYNDLSMVKVATYGIAMQNADGVIIPAASGITLGTNEED